MGIALLTIDRLLSPLQGFVQWLMAGRREVPHAAAPSPRTVVVARPTRKPLRVLRVMDTGNGPSSAGRMVISGRMADVCAELDRLAALEAAHC